jgi:hypothetical protein
MEKKQDKASLCVYKEEEIKRSYLTSTLLSVRLLLTLSFLSLLPLG